MRTIVLILTMLVVIGGGFYFIALRGRPDMVGPTDGTPPSITGMRVNATQPTALPRVTATSLPTPGENAAIVGASAGVFVESRDPRTGRITHKFRADQLDPHRDGTVGVTRPEVRFYGKDRKGMIVLTGSAGDVTTSSGGNPDDPRSISASTPRDGQLNDVTLRYYDAALDPDRPELEERLLGEPATTTVTIPAAVRFDAVGNRVATVDSVIDGKSVPAERVPIKVRGRDFELDGQGLTLSWNDRTGRLDSLVIERGDRLLVIDVNRFGGSSMLASKPTGASPLPPIGFGPQNVFTGLLAAEVAPSTVPARATQRDLYHVTFDKDVRVTRANVEVAAADALVVAMALGDAGDDAAAMRPNPQSTTNATSPTTRRVRRDRPATSTAPSATRPAEQVEVHWTGKLTVRPAPDTMTEPTVELIGAPAIVRENGAQASGASIRVEPEIGRLRLAPAETSPTIEIRDADGGSLTSQSVLSVDKGAGVILVDGAGSLIAPPDLAAGMTVSSATRPTTGATTASTAPAATQPTTVAWTKRLQIDVDGDVDGPTGETNRQFLKQIAIEGDADVRSAAMNARAQRLTLAFSAPDAGRSDRKAAPQGKYAMPTADFSRLRVVEAEGAADLLTIDPQGRRQSLTANRVRIDLKPGGGDRPVVASLAGDGSVALRNGDGSTLDCGSLDVVLDPKSAAEADPLRQIRKLVAKDAVRLTQTDGTVVTADRVEQTGEAAARRFTLTGTPADLSSNRGALRGQTIELDPSTGSVNVPGAGAFVGKPAEGAETGAMAMSWNGAMSADGTEGVCQLTGGVRVDGTDANQTRIQMSAASALIRFDPTSKRSTTRPAAPDEAIAKVSLDAIRSLTLADLDSIQMTTADGKRDATIETRTLEVDLDAGTVIAPGSGRMLMVQRSVATTQPTSGPTTAMATASIVEPEAAEGGFGPGTLALAWQESMHWTLNEGNLLMNGGVRLGYEKENSDDPVRLTADQLKCQLAPIDPKAQEQPGMERVAQRFEMKAINALGNVTVRSKATSLNAGTLAYNLRTQDATASADDATRLEVFNADGSSQIGFSSFKWNVQTGLGTFTDVGAQVRP